MSLHYAEAQRDAARAALREAWEQGPTAWREGPVASRAQRYRRWEECVRGMSSGAIAVGSRAPLRDVPPFLTPHVLQGGFSSGALEAGGPLLPFERELAAHVGLQLSDSTSEDHRLRAVRARLNAFFLTEAGFYRLHDMLESGEYSLACAEEGALLTVVWLLTLGKEYEAKKIVKAIDPYFGKARFYPRPSEMPVSLQPRCSRLTVGMFKTRVEWFRTSRGSFRYATNKLMVEGLAPAYDALVALVLATCEGTSEGDLKPFTSRPGQGMVEAFRVVKRRFEGVRLAYASLLDAAMRTNEELRQLGPTRNCGLMLRAAEEFFLSRRKVKLWADTAIVRRILTQIRDCSRRGLPKVWLAGDDLSRAEVNIDDLPPKLRDFRTRQRKTTEKEQQLISDDWKGLSIARVDAMTADTHIGLESVASLVQPVTKREAKAYELKEGAQVPRAISSMAKMLERGYLDDLLERDQVPSMEVLADLMDQVVGAEVAQQGSMEFRRLYAAQVGAFRRRRSLLLLNYESQVKFDELPWVPYLETVRKEEKSGSGGGERAYLLCKLIRLCMLKWPQTIIPNKLLTVLDELGRDAAVCTKRGSWLKLTPELAADIFMGGFMPRWVTHAEIAREMLADSLYGKYYQARDGEPLWEYILGADEKNTRLSRFTALCEKSAKRQKLTGYVSYNGGMVEEAMVLTGHNYPYLLEVLEAYDESPSEKEFYEACTSGFRQVQEMLKVGLNERNDWQGRLQATKNAAYGWRQVVLLLSTLGDERIEHFFSEMVSRGEAAKGVTLQRALVDLRSVWRQMRQEQYGVGLAPRRAWRAFYGWHGGEHPLWKTAWCRKVKEKTFVALQGQGSSSSSEKCSRSSEECSSSEE